MQSGYPQSQAGGSPAFYQHWHNDAFQSVQKNSTAFAPIFQPANGQNIPAIPNELKVAYDPPQRQWGNTQSSQHNLAFQRKNKLQVVLECYGPHNLIQIKPNGHHHKSTEVNAVPQAFVHDTVQSHNFSTSGNVGGQQRKLFKSDMNNDEEHQQKQLLNYSSLESTNSAVIQSYSLGVAAQTSERAMRLIHSSPLLCGLLKRNPTNKGSLPTLSSKSEENNGNNYRHPTTQNPHSSGTQTRSHQQQDITSSHQQQDITSSVSSQRGLPAWKTDEQILDYIKEKIKMFKTNNGHKNKNKRLNSNNRDSLKSNIKSNTSAHSTTFNSEEGQGLDPSVTEHYLNTLWPRREVDSSEGSKAHPEFAVKSDMADSCGTSAPEQHPTEYQQIMQKVAGSLTKNEDEVPIVLTTWSGMTMDELAENHPGSTLNCSSSEEEYKTQWLNTNSNLDSIDQVPGVSWSLLSENKRGAVPKAKAEVGQVDCDPSMDLPFKSSRPLAFKVVSEDVTAGKMKNTEDQHQLIHHSGSKFKSQADKIQICNAKSLLEQSGDHSNQKHLKGEQDSVCLGFALFESKAERQEPLPESKVEDFCKNPQYEDISDEDQPRMVAQVAKTIHEGSNILVGCRDPQYEDISEDDNSQNRNFDLDIEMAESNSAQSPLENEDLRHKQGQAEMKSDNISIEDHSPELPDDVQKCCCPYYIETEHGFESMLCPNCERHLERQKDQPIICSSLSDQKNEDADGQNSDSESDDDFIVIPLIVSNLKFESEDQIHKNKDIIVLSDDESSETDGEGRQAGPCSTRYDSSHPASVPQAANRIEIYETLKSYLREQNLERSYDCLAANSDVVSDKITSECEMSSTGSVPYPTVPSETEGTSETEDSCNYSSDPESNYLTVSKCLLVARSSYGPVEADDSVSAAENEVNDYMNVHTSKTMACPTSKAGPSDKSTTFQKLRQLMNTKSSRKRNRPKVNKQRISKQNDTIDSESEDESGQNCKKVKKRFFSSRSNAPYTQHHGHPPKAVNSEIYHAQFEDAMNDEERSDTQDRRDPDFKKVKRKSSSSELGETDKAQRHSPEPVYIRSKTSTEKVKKSMQSSADLSYAQNKVYDVQLGDMKKKTCSYMSNSEQQIKANVVSKHRQKTSEDKGSEPKRRSAETVDQLCGAGGKSSSENSAEKPQSVAKVSGSELVSSLTIPHLVVNKSRKHCDGLKLSDKDKTRTLRTTNANKKNGSSKKNKLKNVNKSERGKFVSEPQLPEDRHHESEDQGSKGKEFSRQLSLPNQLPSTSKNNSESRNRLAYSSRVLSCDAESSVSSNHLTFEQNPSIPKQHSSRLKQSHYSSVSRRHGTPSGLVSPSTMQTSAKKQVTENWNNSYFPTPKDKKANLGAEEDARSSSTFVKNTSDRLHQESSKEVRPGPSHERVRQRNSSHEYDRPLMKRAKDDFRKLAEGRIRDPSTEQSRNVGEGYKWKEKPPAARLQKSTSERHLTCDHVSFLSGLTELSNLSGWPRPPPFDGLWSVKSTIPHR
ncbi:uncharacterized protein LOC115430556 isoform X2 [Sphaeramia orbicularis]|uniref:uncharacterized protein LOC115430556 isoform X2 n=1 Tax=Sphaeramia orbicularis TaxID=375764 RepID=UPI00117E3CF5|nr:uncharacterized protein LOC115430556 isoform X2 [Sphaeramia orbicularis]